MKESRKKKIIDGLRILEKTQHKEEVENFCEVVQDLMVFVSEATERNLEKWMISDLQNLVEDHLKSKSNNHSYGLKFYHKGKKTRALLSLQEIKRAGGLVTAGEIASLLQIQTKDMSTVLGSLERHGFIIRIEEKRQNTKFLWEITNEGIETIARAEEQAHERHTKNRKRAKKRKKANSYNASAKNKHKRDLLRDSLSEAPSAQKNISLGNVSAPERAKSSADEKVPSYA